ncbi:MAG: hypothetical protein ACYTDV_17105 [Planctomycetota bacterium]|jgi:hypothetical protein
MSEELEALKMRDTHPDIAVQYRNMMMRRSGEERLRMGCSMYDAARQIVRSAILETNAGVTDAEMKKEIFLRFYGHEFSRNERDKVISALTRRRS